MIGKAILIIIVLLIIRWLIRPMFAFEVRRNVEKMREEERARYQKQQQQNKRSYSDGNVNVDYIPEDYNKKKKDDPSSGKGEYIDYEDVK